MQAAGFEPARRDDDREMISLVNDGVADKVDTVIAAPSHGARTRKGAPGLRSGGRSQGNRYGDMDGRGNDPRKRGDINNASTLSRELKTLSCARHKTRPRS